MIQIEPARKYVNSLDLLTIHLYTSIKKMSIKLNKRYIFKYLKNKYDERINIIFLTGKPSSKGGLLAALTPTTPVRSTWHWLCNRLIG